MSRKSFQIRGFDKLMKQLNTEVAGIQDRTAKGILKAVAHVRTDMDKTPPLIPIDSGNLRRSWTVVTYNVSDAFVARFGFTANYAIPVHEVMGRSFKRPGAGPRFFYAAIRRNQQKILDIIAEEAAIV